MHRKLHGKSLRIVLPLILAICSLAILLGILAGPQDIVHALSRRFLPTGDESRVPIDLVPPLPSVLASARPPKAPTSPSALASVRSPQFLLPQVSQAPSVLQVCSSCPYVTVQAAVDAAAQGDTIQVATGVYTDSDADGYVVEINKTLTLRGGYTTTNWALSNPDAYPTELDGQDVDLVVYIAGNADPTIEGFHIHSGSAANGAGVYIASGSPFLRRNRIYDNAADFSGGGVYIVDGGALVENNLIYDNVASTKRGGGLYIAGGAPTIGYNTFYNNQSLEQGGGIFIAAGSPTIMNTIFDSNAASFGGGIYGAGGTPSIDYNAYSNNAPDNYNNELFAGTHNKFGDPAFVNVTARNFRLESLSLCRGAASSAYPQDDYDGYARPFVGGLDAGADIGAHEYHAGTCFARAGTGQVYDNVQAAVDAAGAGDEVKVVGVCSGSGTEVVSIGKNLTLRGGYTLSNWIDPDPSLYLTVLDGSSARRVIDVGNVNVTIEGFHIQNGSATFGAGIYVLGGSIVIQDNVILSNTVPFDGAAGAGIYIAANTGGIIRGNDIYNNEIASAVATWEHRGGAGIHIASGDLTVEDNDVHDNVADTGYGGGGIYVRAGNATIRGNRIYNNIQQDGNNGGGGIYVRNGSATIERNAIFGNSASGFIGDAGGGGVYIEEGSSTIRNNLIYSNSVDTDNEGGGIFCWTGGPVATPLVENNTFYANSAGSLGSGGGGIYCNSTLRNNIVVSNTNGRGTATACDYCDVYGNSDDNNTGAVGDISLDPLFVNAGVDFHLQAGSPARGTITDTAYPADDYDGYARPFIDGADAGADVGAYEYYAGPCAARLNSGAIYGSVQNAIHAASAGDSIYVAGTCTASGAPVAYITQTLTLRGGYTLTNWTAPSTWTILDGDRLQRVVYITGTDPVTVDGFIIQNGNAGAGAGAGLYIANPVNARVQNVVFYNNTSTGSGILASVGGNDRLYNNTFVSNTVGTGGGIVDIPAGSPISNTIIASNTGNALNGLTCDYCDVWGNTDDTNTVAAVGAISADPRFIDLAGGDFRLRSDSPCVYAGDPNTGLDHDFEGDARLLGRGYDIGADECAFYPGLLFEPKLSTNYTGAPGRTTVHTHYLTNTGSVADTFDLTHSLTYSGGTDWVIDYQQSINLDGGSSLDVPVSVIVPADAISGSVATVVLTATSQNNPALYEVVTNVTYISWNPVVTITPLYTGFLNPGDVVTYVHTIQNLGNAPDSFTVTVASLRGWSYVTPTLFADMAPGASATVWLVVSIPGTSPGGITETVAISVVNWTLDAGAVVIDTFEINHVPGDRYVATTGTNTDNNCQVLNQPCRTIEYAVGQAASGDTVKVAAGTYREYDLLLNKTITVAGGYSRDGSLVSFWGGSNPDPDLNVTIIDAEGNGRVIEILGSPTVEGFTLRNGSTPGAGGGVYIATGAPALRDNKIVYNTAGSYGGGIYNWLGTPTIERNEIAHNTAYLSGGGFATNANAVAFWNNMVYLNAAGADGGGMYVIGGNPSIVHGTFYGNTANQGAGLFLYGGATTINNSIIVNNTATTLGGGVHAQTAGTGLSYNDVWGNLPQDYVGPLSAGPNSVALDPMLINPAGDDVHLQPNSPVGDIGGPSALSVDIDGDPRVVNTGPDMGADEFIWGTVEFGPDYSGLASFCGSVTYAHVVTHTGRYTDTFDFVSYSTLGVTVTTVPPQVDLGYMMTATVDVVVSVPCALVGPIRDTTVVTTTSQNYSFIRDSVVVTTYIDVVPLLQLEPDRSGYSPPGNISYTHTLTNAGNYTDTVSFKGRITSNQWGLSVPGPLTLGPGASTVITVWVTIPSNAISGTQETAYITVTTMFGDMVNGISAEDSVVDITTAGPRAQVDVEKLLPIVGYCIYPPEQNWVWFDFTVTNDGNLDDIFRLDAGVSGSRPWTVTIGTTPPYTRPVPWVQPFGVNQVMYPTVRVEVPVSTPTGIVETVTLSGTSWFDPSATDSESYELKIIDVDVEMDGPFTRTFDHVALQSSVTFKHVVTNTGQVVNQIVLDLCKFTSFSWPRTYDPPTQRLILNPGESGEFLVTVDVPWTVYTATETLCLEATTEWECISSDQSRNTVLIRRPGVRLEPNRDPLHDPETYVIPGTVVTYTHVLSNVGATTDTYAITWTPQPAPSSWPTWTVSVTPTTVYSLPPGGGVLVTAVMTVPAGMQFGDGGVLVLTATSSFTDVIYDIAVANMLVPPMPEALFTPNRSGQAVPGQWVVYTHTLTNIGNSTDYFTVTTHSEFGFSQVIDPPYPHDVLLEPGQTYTPIIIRVFIPPYAEGGSVEETEVIVTFNKDPTGKVKDQAVVVDSTTVQWATGMRYVSSGGVDQNNNCTDPQNYAPCATIQHAIGQAQIGEEIRVAQGTYNDIHSTAGVTQVVYIDKNVVLRGGYAITDWVTFNPGGNLTILDAGGQGRVIYVLQNLAPTIAGFHLTGGYVSDDDGAGVYVASGATPVVEMNYIYNNTATGFGVKGGGLYYAGTGNLVLRQNTIYNNTAEDGCGVYLVGGDSSVWNNVFYSNVAGGLGGGLYLQGGSPMVWNNTFYSNTADLGGGLYYMGSGAPVISNTIFAGNTARNVSGGGGLYLLSGTPAMDYNDYWSNTNGYAVGAGIGTNSLLLNPLFVNEGTFDLHLTAGSPCKDAGDPDTLLNVDREGKLRPLLTGYDMGAYEYGLEFVKTGPAVITPSQYITYTIVVTNSSSFAVIDIPVTDTLSPYLDFQGSPTGQYLAASRTISWTISVPGYSRAQLQFTVRVTDNLPAGGVIENSAWVNYQQTNMVTSTYRTCWVRLNNDPVDYDNVQAAVDVSQFSTDVVKVAGYCIGVSARTGISQVIYLTKTLTIRGGYAFGNWNTSDGRANPTTVDAFGQGRVLYIAGNISPTIESLRLLDGDAGTGAGGGVYVLTATATLSGNLVLNSTADVGGGVYLANSDATLINNIIADNQAGTAGSGLYVAGGDVTMLHNTIANNGGAAGHGIYVTGYGPLQATVALTNTILSGHTTGISVTVGNAATLNGVLWYPAKTISGSIVITSSNEYVGDPVFVDPGAGDYHLSVGSSARDVGVPTGLDVDIDGDTRPWNGLPDLGADEFLAGVSVTKRASSPLTVQAGDSLTYTIYVTNTGPIDLNLTITDTLPAHVASSDATNWTPSTPLAPGEVWMETVSVVVEMGYSGTLTNTVEAVSLEGAAGTYSTTTQALVTPAVSVIKHVTPSLVQAGDSLTYTIYVTNTGNITGTATITDILPAQATHPTATNVLTWAAVLAPLTGTWSTQFTVSVNLGYSGTLSNQVQVTTLEGGSTAHVATAESRVTPALSVIKRVDPAVVYAGNQLTYTIYVTNTGNATGTTTITDVLPAQVTHPTATNVLTWAVVLAPLGGTWSTQFTVTVDAGYPGTLTNVVLVTTAEGATGVFTETAFSLAPAVTVAKQADPPLVVQAGDQLTYTIVVTNVGTMGLSGIVVTDTLPPQVAPTGVMTWPVPALVPGETWTWTTEVVVDVAWGYSGTLVNRVDVTTNEGVTATHTQSTLAQVTPAVSITKRPHVPAVLAGNPLTYTIYVTNTGNIALTATITDVFPPNATPVGSQSWPGISLPVPGGTWSTTIVVTPNAGYAGVIANVATVTTDLGATDTYTGTAISMAPDLSVIKKVSSAPVPAGDPLTYTIYVTNTGTMDLNLIVIDTLPAQVVPSGIQAWNPVTPLAPGLVWSTTVNVVVKMGYSGTLTNTVDASSFQGASDTFTLLSQALVTPAVSIAKRVDPDPVPPLSPLTYTVYVTNTGNITLTAAITDILPAQVAPTGTLTWSVTIVPRAAWSQTIFVTATTASIPLVNSVYVSTDKGVSGMYVLTTPVCYAMGDLILVGPIGGAPGVSQTFTATIVPATAETPITYTWEAEGQSTVLNTRNALSDTVTFNWVTMGTYAITVTAESGCGPAIVRTYTIIVSTCPYPLTDIAIAGSSGSFANIPYTYTAVLTPPTPTTPVTYTWSPAPDSGQGTPSARYQWPTTGMYTVILTAENCGGVVSATHTVDVFETCVGVTGVRIAGPSVVQTDTLYTYVANILPSNASTVTITYLWSPPPVSGQGTASAQYQWPTTGTRTISVTVQNCGGTAVDSHAVSVEPVSPVYLPLIVRNYYARPDLEVTDIQVVWGTGADPDHVLVTIRNNGPGAVSSDFWVDLYLDPSSMPAVGDLWNDLSTWGKAWIVRNPLIRVGDTYVLDTRDPDDPANPGLRFSRWPDKLPAGSHMIYAQADSYWLPFGMVIEADETNNVFGLGYVQSAGQPVQPVPQPPPPAPVVVDTPVPVQTPQPRPTSSKVRATSTPAP